MNTELHDIKQKRIYMMNINMSVQSPLPPPIYQPRIILPLQKRRRRGGRRRVDGILPRINFATAAIMLTTMIEWLLGRQR